MAHLENGRRRESNREEDLSATSKFKARIREAMRKKAVIPSKVEESRRKSSRVTPRDPSTSLRSAQDDRLPDLPSAKARFVEPMKAKLVEKPPVTGDWMYELKFDGIRLIAVKSGEKVSLLSRNQNELGARFPEIVEAVKSLPAHECVIDGEVVALDKEGRSCLLMVNSSDKLVSSTTTGTDGSGRGVVATTGWRTNNPTVFLRL